MDSVKELINTSPDNSVFIKKDNVTYGFAITVNDAEINGNSIKITPTNYGLGQLKFNETAVNNI